ncbi:aldehyde dehydrogenase family protein [Pelagibacterium lacus]|uniref:Aldehyde dehydrogenase family protein n=1 Tax=Pelagibacterium lacus TaxID=2282655 RepID=A0A369W0F0_9HYPH|nr:aldehyde dehydrogenase family protein [Pelagibacterium lacus]RDE07853.1 aldehyde dehydrogenase family protein [Pelagibacterium lacus]
MLTAPLLIGGELVGSSSGQVMESIAPVTGDVLGQAQCAAPDDVDAAVAAARSAGPAWQGLGMDGRIAALRRVAVEIRTRAEDIATLETHDTGNLYAPMLGDARRAADRIDYYAGFGHAVLGNTYPATTGHLHFSTREPFGVVARIVAFNHPFYFLASRMAAPLVMGNTVVLKTPDQAPLSGGILAEICQKHLPAGVVNIIHGEGAVAGDALVVHPQVKRIGFIGSVPTAQRISARAAGAGVKFVTHELGGKNLMVVLPDADPEKAAKLAIEGMNFQWQGQSCGSTSVLCVHDALYDAVVSRVQEQIRAIRVGDPFDPQSGMGPLISADHHRKVTAAIERGRAEGATLLAGGGRPEGEGFARGYWVEPTLFGDVAPHAALAQDEIFGPVLSAVRWSSVEEIVAMDDRSPLGLTASVVGRDIEATLALGRRLNVGYVYINCVGPHYVGVPYGGMKNSGVGREEGLEEMLSYTETKSFNIAVPAL